MKRAVVMLALVIAAGASLVIWSWREGAEERALAGLSPIERQTVYARELAALQALCGARSDEGLRERCGERARFILKFPECDSQCQHLARTFLPGPER
jgi:hypothetical protein